jgi:hypothetical protein
MTLSEAVAELERRRKDSALRAKVENYLGGDIPECFTDGPILYLARHVATPNQETRAFLELAEQLGYRAVIGQDPGDIFAPHNSLKRALGKLPVVRGYSHDGGEILEYVTVIDFNSASGKRISEIRTFAGKPLTQFHNDLFARVLGKLPTLSDDTVWIDRNQRGNLLEHYKRHLALYITHGILFEYFPVMDSEEQRMVASVLAPAFEALRSLFGVGPLITPPVSPSMEHGNWETYPLSVYSEAAKHARDFNNIGL